MQKKFKLLATSSSGLESLVARELRNLEIENVSIGRYGDKNYFYPFFNYVQLKHSKTIYIFNQLVQMYLLIYIFHYILFTF